MTAQSPKPLSDHPHSTSATPLTPTPTLPTYSSAPLSSPSSMSTTGRSGKITDADDDHAIDFAASSWDLATGGLKALTAKREVPSLVERRPSGNLPTAAAAPRSYLFTVVILACLVVMLISGGVVLIILLQP